ncbi:hypothetical protein [Leminorella grimontii]|uniref:hypothetical protein n=1 Tax=Leminorella grimontii TaxID=82981 RepID=UPI0021C32C1B|nr:hypothetical protein [Leminorella grimontii]
MEKGTLGALGPKTAANGLIMDVCLIDLKDLCGMAVRDIQDIHLREYTDWAEQQVIKGNASENVLILASLGLDPELDWYDVSRYFYAYLREVGVSIPERDEADYYYVRRAFKKIAFANSDEELWFEVAKYFSGWYLECDSSSINKVVWHWNRVYDDFAYIDDDPYFLDMRYGNIPKEKHVDYVRALAVRFYRLFNSEHFILFLKKPGQLVALSY